MLPGIQAEHDFPDVSTAEQAVADAMSSNDEAIRAWLETSDSVLVVESDAGSVVGRFVADGSTDVIDVTRVRVVLVRDDAFPDGYRVLTSYPRP